MENHWSWIKQLIIKMSYFSQLIFKDITLQIKYQQDILDKLKNWF